MRFKDYFYNVFLEKRSTPKQYVVDQLEKYKDDPDVFISFTMDLGGPKLGVNPKSTYGTPLGIYSYPLKIMWDDIKSYWNIPFAKEHPNIFVFKPKDTNRILYSSKYHIADLQKDFPQYPREPQRYAYVAHSPKENEEFFKRRYKEIFPNGNDVIEMFIHNHTNKDNKIDYTTILGEIAYQYLDEYKNFEFQTNLDVPFSETLDGFISDNISAAHQKNYAQIFLSMCRHFAKANPIKWTKEILNHGYIGVCDNNGSGIIHTNEPTQAVFFRTRDLQILDLIKSKGNNNWNREKPDQGLI
jgi:hypothetical protein